MHSFSSDRRPNDASDRRRERASILPVFPCLGQERLIEEGLRTGGENRPLPLFLFDCFLIFMRTCRLGSPIYKDEGHEDSARERSLIQQAQECAEMGCLRRGLRKTYFGSFGLGGLSAFAASHSKNEFAPVACMPTWMLKFGLGGRTSSLPIRFPL